ncbi:hypothetical protein [Streptomyces sp. NPDC021356]|uniref:hypothetical protein n=1 Tax=Streptomyces sp. NPDC021356 TaxID=3154900 RepID=UPI0033BFF779
MARFPLTPGGRAIVFTGAIRNSLVVLPLALALPAGLEVAAVVLVTQTLVEVLGMVTYAPRKVAIGTAFAAFLVTGISVTGAQAAPAKYSLTVTQAAAVKTAFVSTAAAASCRLNPSRSPARVCAWASAPGSTCPRTANRKAMRPSTSGTP